MLIEQMSATGEIFFAVAAIVVLAIGVFGLNSIFDGRRKAVTREQPSGPRYTLIYDDPEEEPVEEQEEKPVRASRKR